MKIRRVWKNKLLISSFINLMASISNSVDYNAPMHLERTYTKKKNSNAKWNGRTTVIWHFTWCLHRGSHLNEFIFDTCISAISTCSIVASTGQYCWRNNTNNNNKYLHISFERMKYGITLRMVLTCLGIVGSQVPAVDVWQLTNVSIYLQLVSCSVQIHVCDIECQGSFTIFCCFCACRTFHSNSWVVEECRETVVWWYTGTHTWAKSTHTMNKYEYRERKKKPYIKLVLNWRRKFN